MHWEGLSPFQNFIWILIFKGGIEYTYIYYRFNTKMCNRYFRWNDPLFLEQYIQKYNQVLINMFYTCFVSLLIERMKQEAHGLNHSPDKQFKSIHIGAKLSLYYILIRSQNKSFSLFDKRYGPLFVKIDSPWHKDTLFQIWLKLAHRVLPIGTIDSKMLKLMVKKILCRWKLVSV